VGLLYPLGCYFIPPRIMCCICSIVALERNRKQIPPGSISKQSTGIAESLPQCTEKCSDIWPCVCAQYCARIRTFMCTGVAEHFKNPARTHSDKFYYQKNSPHYNFIISNQKVIYKRCVINTLLLGYIVPWKLGKSIPQLLTLGSWNQKDSCPL
jgi:hypothetical protein